MITYPKDPKTLGELFHYLGVQGGTCHQKEVSGLLGKPIKDGDDNNVLEITRWIRERTYVKVRSIAGDDEASVYIDYLPHDKVKKVIEFLNSLK